MRCASTNYYFKKSTAKGGISYISVALHYAAVGGYRSPLLLRFVQQFFQLTKRHA